MTASAVRRDRLRAAARAAGLDAVLVTRLVNVRYLTGFTGSNAALLVPAGADRPERALHRRPLHRPGGEQAPDLERLIERDQCASRWPSGRAEDGRRSASRPTT